MFMFWFLFVCIFPLFVVGEFLLIDFSLVYHTYSLTFTYG